MIDNFTDTELEQEQEQWRDIEGYDGMYQVSDLGRVRSRKSGEWKMLRTAKVGIGYLRVSLCKDGKVKEFYVHRLVAQAFIPNDDETKIYINHIDECKQNNRVSNLEYCTAQYNLTYNNLNYRRWTNRNDYKRDKIKPLYNPNLSIGENIELFKENGIKCCRETVRRLRRDLGLTKHYRPRKKAN